MIFPLIFFFGMSVIGLAAPQKVNGPNAQALYELATDSGDPDGKGPVEMSAGCHYHKRGLGFTLLFCDCDTGDYITPPFNETFSQLLLKKRIPRATGNGEYGIGVHFRCVNRGADQYECEIKDLSEAR